MAPRHRASSDPVNPDLEARIGAKPEDAASFRVYADWLLEQGSARGELAALQLAREERRLKSLRLRAEALLERHADTFFGPKDEQGYRIDGHATVLTWKGGFWKRLGLSGTADTVERALGLTSARLLQSLAVDMDGPDHSAVARAIGERADPLVALRSLTIGGDPEGQSALVEAPDRRCFGLAAAARKLPRLERLLVRVADFDFASFPALRTLRIEGEGVRGSALRALFAVDLPSLTRLDLLLAWFDDEEAAPPFAAADLAGLLEGERLPALRHLAIHVMTPGESLRSEIEAAVESAPIRRRLRSCVVDDEFEPS